MKISKWNLSNVGTLAGLILLMTVPLEAQDDPIDQRITKIEEQLTKIESRLARIENVLFATIRYSEAEARRQLEQAQANLAQSQRLHAQGLISAAQLELERMELDRAETLLRMCVQHEDHRKIGATLEVLDARQEYERLLLNLQLTQQLFDRGLAARQRISQDKAAITLAEKKLKLAEERLKELKASQADQKADDK